jgi:hypothetical protein
MYVAGKHGGFYAVSEYRKDFYFIRGRVDSRSRKVQLFLFLSKTLRVGSMNYCFKRPQPKFQPQIRYIIAQLIKSLK